MAFPLANEPETMTHMSSYEPDPDTAKLFARHKQATRTIKDTKKPVAEAVEKAIRQGATSPQLAELTGLTSQTIRNIAEKIGVDIRTKPPTVGPEAEARRAGSTQPPPEPRERPSPITAMTDSVDVGALSDEQAAELAGRAFGTADPKQYELLAAVAASGDRAVVVEALQCGALTSSDVRAA